MSLPSDASPNDESEKPNYGLYLVGVAMFLLIGCVSLLAVDAWDTISRRMRNARRPLPPPAIGPLVGIGNTANASAFDISSPDPRTPFLPRYGRVLHTTEGEIFCLPCFDQESIFFGACDGKFRCVDKLTGKLRWEYGQLLRVDSSPIVRGNLVYFANVSGTMFALDKTSGALAWKRQIEGCGYQNPQFSSGRVLISGTDQLLELDPLSGDIVHQYPVDGDGAAFVATPERVVIAVQIDIEANEYTGISQLWCFPRDSSLPSWKIDLDGGSLGEIAVDQERCFIGDRGGQFIGVDLANGAVDWRFDCKELFDDTRAVWADGGVVVKGDNVVFRAHHQAIGKPAAIVSLNRKTGVKNWDTTSPATLAAGVDSWRDSIIAVAHPRSTVVLDSMSGEVRFQGSLYPKSQFSQYRGIRRDRDHLYVVGGDKKVWQLKLPAKLAMSQGSSSPSRPVANEAVAKGSDRGDQ